MIVTRECFVMDDTNNCDISTLPTLSPEQEAEHRRMFEKICIKHFGETLPATRAGLSDTTDFGTSAQEA